jgi:TPR repeat protein
MTNRILKIALMCSLFVAGESDASEASRPGEAAYASGDFASALEMLSPLADNGDVDAQYVLGLMYANGQGVDQSFYEAGKMYRLAGEQDHSAAQVNLGSLFENCYGNGPCNSEAAAAWYRRAADQGDAIAQYNLGVMYGTGRGVPESEWKAKELFRKSAEQGHAPAQYNLAVTYERGLGGPLDRVAAYAWYELAASGDYADGNAGRDKIAAALSSDDLQKAEKLSAVLRESYTSE